MSITPGADPHGATCEVVCGAHGDRPHGVATLVHVTDADAAEMDRRTRVHAALVARVLPGRHVDTSPHPVGVAMRDCARVRPGRSEWRTTGGWSRVDVAQDGPLVAVRREGPSRVMDTTRGRRIVLACPHQRCSRALPVVLDESTVATLVARYRSVDLRRLRAALQTPAAAA